MSLNSKIAADVIESDLGPIVTLFEIDLTDLGGSVYRITNSTDAGNTVQFDSATYYPRPVRLTGQQRMGSGRPPRPKVQIGDLDGTIAGLCRDYQDMIGATFTRIRTLAKYLDGEPGADTSAKFPDEIYVINKKARAQRSVIEFDLSPATDIDGVMIPARLVLCDTCGFNYRVWNGASFDTPTVRPCPYTDAVYFEYDNTSTVDPAEDVCARTLAACKVRYGDTEELPFGGFPGVDRVQRA